MWRTVAEMKYGKFEIWGFGGLGGGGDTGLSVAGFSVSIHYTFHVAVIWRENYELTRHEGDTWQ